MFFTEYLSCVNMDADNEAKGMKEVWIPGTVFDKQPCIFHEQFLVQSV